MKCGPTMPLTMLRPGSQARVAEVRPHGHGMVQRLASLGILRGTELSVLQGDAGGALIVRIGETRLVLGRGMAHRVFVESSVS